MSSPDSPALSPAASAALGAYFWLAAATAVGNDLLHVVGLPFALWALWLAARSALALRRGTSGARGLGWHHAGLAAIASVGAAAPLPGGTPAWYQVASRAVPAASLIAVAVSASGDPRWRRRALWAVAASVTALALATPLALRSPPIDVWIHNQTCARALLHGQHPYAVQLGDAYRGGADYGYRTHVLPYPPLIILVNALGVLLTGDYRWLIALCVPATFALTRAGARRLGAAPATTDLVCFAFLLHPRLAYIVAHGWSEPLLVAALAGFVYFQARAPGGVAQAVCFVLLPALKQYVVAPVAIYFDLRPRGRSIAVAAAVVVATLAPFLIWNFAATLDGLTFQVRYVPLLRTDSLSLTAVAALLFDLRAPQWVGVAAQAAAGLAAYLVVRGHGVAGVLVASGLSLFASFLLGSQAFMNYYLFVAALFLFGALAAPAAEGPAVAPPTLARAALRTAAVALAVTAFGLLAGTAHFEWMCPYHRAFAALAAGRAATIPERGYAVARPDEQIVECTSRHDFGPLSHADRACLCAPRGLRAEEVAARFDPPAACHVDHAVPSRSDEEGLCRHARCDRHLE